MSRLEMATSHTILGIGRPRIEFLGTMRRYPEHGHRSELRQFSIQGGGTVGTALVALVEWDCECRIIAKVSSDPFGQLIRGGFDLPGFDTQGIVTERERISPFAFVALEEGRRMERTVFQTPGNVSPLRPADMNLSLLDGCAALLVDGSEPAAQLAGAQRAKAQSIPVLFDASHPAEGMVELLEYTDVLVASERFTAEVAPQGEYRDSLRAIQKMGPAVVVITRGEEGAVAIEGDTVMQQGIYEDITPLERGGAGDVFFAGIAFGTVQGWPLDKRLQFASAAAGLSCRQIGSWAGVPNLDETTATAWPEDR